MLACYGRTVLPLIVTNWDRVHPCVQQEGDGTVSAMVVEKQKLDNKVKELKDRVQVGGVSFDV